MRPVKTSLFFRILSFIITVQCLFFGLPMDVRAGTCDFSNLRQSASRYAIAEELAGQGDAGLIDFVRTINPLQPLLDEVKKEISAPGTGNLPRMVLFSDPHADIKRADALLADMLNKLIGFEGELAPLVSIEKQLNAQGLSLQDIKEKGAFIVLNGDLLDRGKQGIECFLRFRELVEAGVAQWNLGNHDIWMTANLMRFHLPFYKGFNFYGDKVAEALIAEMRKIHKDWFDDDKAAYKWAEKLMEYQEHIKALDKAILPDAADVRTRFIEKVYKEYSAKWDDQQFDAMEKFIGHFDRIKVPDPYVGLNGIGKTSPEWWNQVRLELIKGREARRNAGDADAAELAAWDEAVDLAEMINLEVAQDLIAAMGRGEWQYRIFASINTQAYSSLEWWATDWIYHKGWGTAAIDELNKWIKDGTLEELVRSGVFSEDLLEDLAIGEFDQSNYLKSKVFQQMAGFYQANANFYYKDKLDNLVTHGWLPLNDEGEIGFTYKGKVYSGRDVFKGLDLMYQDISSPDTTLAEKWEAMSLANSWYADMTTKVKSNHIEAYVNKFGVEKINAVLGVVNWFTGHNPINKFKKIKPMTVENGKAHFEIDFAPGEKFGGIGAWVDVSADGVRIRGYESKESTEVVDNPVTDFAKKGGKFENPGLAKIDYLAALRDHLESEIRRSDVAGTELHKLSEYGREELEGMRVLLRIDLNVLDSSGKIKSEKRLNEALDTIVYLISNGATIVLTSHNGRPKGKVDPALSQRAVADRLQELLRDRDRSMEVIFHDNSINEKGLREDIDLELEEGKVNFLENSRFFTGEEKNYVSFAKALASVADIFGFDAFGTAARVHATTAGAARYLQNIFKGFLMEKEDKYLDEALQSIYGIIMGGGPKMKEKLPVVKNVINNLPPDEGFILPGSSVGNVQLKVRHGVETAVPVSKENEQGYISLEEMASARGIDLPEPVDYVVCDMDIFQEKPGTGKAYADLKELPAGAGVFVVTLEQFIEGAFENEGRIFSSRDVHPLSVGPATAELYRTYIMNTPEGKAVFQNGAVGVDEIKAFAEGQNFIWQALADATQKGVITVAGGGDTVKSAERAKVTVKGKETTADKAITHASTGGGASADKLQGKVLAAEQDQKERQADINRILSDLRTTAQELARFKVSERKIADAQGLDFFARYVTAVKNDVNNIVVKGDLSKAVWTAEIIKDSRGRDTVRVIMRVGDIEVKGEVPAGASTGEDEAKTIPLLRKIKMKVEKNTVTVQKDDYDFVMEKQKEIADSLGMDMIKVQVADRHWTEEDEIIEESVKDYALARENLEKIFIMLEKAKLDISKFDDLVQAENMIREAAGKNFVDLGANVTVPVSWALWRMSAALNDMTLKEYIRWNYADILAGKKTHQPVRFYMNIYNGGKHAVKGDEKLGKDRIDIQEIMIVPYADSYDQALKMGDKIDQELKKILEARFAAGDIARADEAGFSVKGLGSSTDAIGYVIQAIENAGYVPGKDVKLALDAAAASFYNKETGMYDFMGEEKTSQDMIDYYVSLAEKYQGVILSIEDGLDENDWDFWPGFTEAMSNYNILTIGDDLYVTQMGRFSKGNDRKAATAILIKVNQNGSVLGTLEVIAEAIANGVEYVVSHRSGETTDDAIADLAEAMYALGLKTGDPQPEHAGYAVEELVRRNKYLRMIFLQEKTPYLRGRVMVLSDEFFKLGSTTDAVQYMLSKMGKELKIMVYGADAENIKLLLGDEKVLTAPDLAQAKETMDVLGFTQGNRVLIQPSWENLGGADSEAASAMKGMKFNDMPMLALAKALKELFPSDYNEFAFEQYFSMIETFDIVSQESSAKYKDDFLDKKLEIGETFSVTDLKIEKGISEAVKEEKDTVLAFMTKI